MESVSTKDYYDTNGVLLLAKGMPITLKMLKKLQLYNAIDSGELTASRELETMRYSERAQKLKERFTGLNIQTVNQVSSTLIELIFESKQNPWWIYVNALSNRIDWLYTHSIDVAMISLLIAVELQYPSQKLRELGLGALLHDIGKLLIPKRILQKAAALNEVEKILLNQHCELGMDCLAGCTLSEAGANIIMQHHERLNGSGYPNHLKADQISEYAKIVMVADTFDALTAGRPYTEAKGAEEALRMLAHQNEDYEMEYVRTLDVIMAAR